MKNLLLLRDAELLRGPACRRYLIYNPTSIYHMVNIYVHRLVLRKIDRNLLTSLMVAIPLMFEQYYQSTDKIH